MSSPTERVKILLRDLQQDAGHYQQLTLLLKQQREALLACQTERSRDIGHELMSVYSLLHASARRRAETLTGFTLMPDGSGMQALFSRLPVALCQRATAGWRQLEHQARLCQQLNQRNGLLLNGQQEILASVLHQHPQDFLYSR